MCSVLVILLLQNRNFLGIYVCFLENILPFPATITMYVLDVVCCTRQKVSAAKDKCRISRHRVEVDQIAINLDTTIVDTTINPLLLPSIPATRLARS